jgi:hypothetical protein
MPGNDRRRFHDREDIDPTGKHARYNDSERSADDRPSRQRAAGAAQGSRRPGSLGSGMRRAGLRHRFEEGQHGPDLPPTRGRCQRPIGGQEPLPSPSRSIPIPHESLRNDFSATTALVVRRSRIGDRRHRLLRRKHEPLEQHDVAPTRSSPPSSPAADRRRRRACRWRPHGRARAILRPSGPHSPQLTGLQSGAICVT